MRDHPFIGKTRDELDGGRWRRLGSAEHLLDFLVDRQTAADGSVYYNREIGYAWIRARIPDPPPLRTLQFWMQKLKRLGEIRVKRIHHGGMKITVLRSRKWSRQTEIQFPQDGFPQPVEKPVEIRPQQQISLPQSVAVGLPQSVAVERSHRKGNANKQNPARETRADFNRREFNREKKIQRLEREALTLIEAYAGAHGDDLVRRDYKLGLIHAEIDRLERFALPAARAG